jgi:DNA-binding NtrC family response regulator
MRYSIPKIVVIHDDLTETDALLVTLRAEFKDENVVLYKKSKDGLEYVINNISQKTIVILDLNFKAGEPSGVDVFEEIRKRTALMYIIIMTASNLGDIENTDLIKFINNDALAFFYSTADTKAIVGLVKKSIYQMEVRVDSVIEEWIMTKPVEEREKPFIQTQHGDKYSLNDILKGIREQSEIGKEIEKNILKLAIDLLMRKKESLND